MFLILIENPFKQRNKDASESGMKLGTQGSDTNLKISASVQVNHGSVKEFMFCKF